MHADDSGQANQTGELKGAELEPNEAIKRMRAETEKLLALLTSPEPGLFSWAMAVNDTIVRIVNIHNGQDD